MKHLLVLFALLAVGSASVWEGGLKIRFDIGINFGSTFFINIPRTVDDAVSEGWTSQTPPPGLWLTSVSLYCYSDLIVCCFYDSYGDVAGVQVALPQDNFTPHFDMETNGFTVWTVDGLLYWTLQQYFTTEEILSSRVGRANENKITENGGVWVVGTHKEVLRIANTTSQLVSDGNFTRQACIPWMGRHYLYNMSSNTNCSNEPVYPWFPIMESDELIAIGLMVFGQLNLDSSMRNWFEYPSKSDVEMIAPTAPECLYELAGSPGAITMHTYYVNQPWLVSCIFQ